MPLKVWIHSWVPWK